jgi:hypothetical protein
MARTEVTLTDTYQEVATAEMVLTVKKGLGELIQYNDVNSDTASAKEIIDGDTQIAQNEVKSTWVKTDQKGVDANVIVIIDEA